jgi:molybdate transport system substrate-binding protein
MVRHHVLSCRSTYDRYNGRKREDAMKIRVLVASAATLVSIVGLRGPAVAVEITIFANQGAASATRDLVPAFEKASGHKAVVKFLAGNAMNEAIKSNAPGDVVSSLLEAFDGLVKDGKVVAGTAVEYARAGNGVAVKAGARKPDISTVEAFKQAMLNAKSIGHSANGTGPFNTKLFQRLGIYDQIKDKIKIIEGRPVANAVAAGDIEIGIQQTNVIQPVAGTDYVGPLPAELMEYGRFGLGVLTVSKEREAAKQFIKFATSPEAAPLIRKSAMEPPAK